MNNKWTFKNGYVMEFFDDVCDFGEKEYKTWKSLFPRDVMERVVTASAKQLRPFTCYYCNTLITSKGSAHHTKCPVSATGPVSTTAIPAVTTYGPGGGGAGWHPTYATGGPGKVTWVTGDTTAGVRSGPAEASVKCDCGGAKTTGTHSDWCSTNKPTDEQSFEDTIPYGIFGIST